MADALITEFKTCTKCAATKPVAEFSPRPDRPGGYRSNCKACASLASANYRRCNPENAREYQRAHRQEATARTAEWRANNPLRVLQIDREYKARHREALRADGRERYQRDRDKIRERKRLARLRDHALTLATERKCREENRERINAASRRACAKRRATARGALENAIRARIAKVLQGGGKGGRKTFEILGYTASELIIHLERQFSPSMTWENYGKWHIDHIRPVSSFSYQGHEDQAFKDCWALNNLRPLWAFDNLSKGARPFLLV